MEDINNELNKIIRKANKQQDFSEVNSLLDDNLEKLKNAKTILSFDMEFDNRSGDNVVEIGVAIYNKETQETYSEHFIIEEEIGNYKRNNTPMEHKLMFAHGESKEVSLKSAMKSLNMLMKNSDVHIIYADKDKRKHLEEHGIESEFLNVQNLLRLNSSSNQATPLTEAVQLFGKKEQPVHNAGNDAAVTLEIISEVFGDKIGMEKYESPVVIDYSEHPKKISGEDIKESRKANREPFLNDKYTQQEVKATRKITL